MYLIKKRLLKENRQRKLAVLKEIVCDVLFFIGFILMFAFFSLLAV